MNILNIKIDDVNRKEALKIVEGWLVKPGKHWIATPNPEMVVKAQKDAEFRKTLNEADLAIPDGVGLKLVGVKNRIAGVDLMMDLVKLAADKGYTVGFLGGRDGVAVKARDRLLVKYPNLKVSLAQEEFYEQRSSRINERISADRDPRESAKNPRESIDILFVALGHGKQEAWIVQNLDKIPVKVAMGVGGAFDYISGRVPRAPLLVRKIGLEWLFRLIIQPWRIKRQLALLKFIWLIVRFRG